MPQLKAFVAKTGMEIRHGETVRDHRGITSIYEAPLESQGPETSGMVRVWYSQTTRTRPASDFGLVVREVAENG